MEELWQVSTEMYEGAEVVNYTKPICIVMEENGSASVPIVCRKNRVLQVDVMNVFRYKEQTQ